jgi:aspartate aminotransferase
MTVISERLSLIKPSPTLAVASRAIELKSQGFDVINLGVGEPDFDTPDNIKIAAKKAIDEGFTKYTPVEGFKGLKQAICDKFKNENNLDYDLNQIIVSTGGKQSLYNVFLAMLNPGDEVLIPAPYWVSYPDMVLLAGGVPVIVDTQESNNFLLAPAELRKAITDRTKIIIINSPSNPTGAVYSKEQLESLAQILLEFPHIYVVSDDIYEHLIFDNKPFYNIVMAEPAIKSRVVLINGVSKSYSMTGWRIGYAAADKQIVAAMTKIQSQVTSNPCSISQMAAFEALSGDQSFLEFNRKTFERRRDLVVSLIGNIKGLRCPDIHGAFYAFISCNDLVGKKTVDGNIVSSDNEFAKYILDKALVAVVPGEAFGKSGYFRISFALSDEIIKEACARIKKACDALI